MVAIRRTLLFAGSLVLVLLTSANASVIVKFEQLNPADPGWKFKSVPGPSKSDIGSSAKVTVVGNEVDPQAPPRRHW